MGVVLIRGSFVTSTPPYTMYSMASYLIISPLAYRYPLNFCNHRTFSPKSITLFLIMFNSTYGSTSVMLEFRGAAERV